MTPTNGSPGVLRRLSSGDVTRTLSGVPIGKRGGGGGATTGADGSSLGTGRVTGPGGGAGDWLPARVAATLDDVLGLGPDVGDCAAGSRRAGGDVGAGVLTPTGVGAVCARSSGATCAAGGGEE